MLRAVKLWKSSSMCGPSATEKPISPKIATISSTVWLIGWMRPTGEGRAGSVMSIRSSASRASSSASSKLACLRASMAAAIASFTWLSAWPAALRASGSRPPRPFMRWVTAPFLPSASTRTSSRAARLAAAAAASRYSLLRPSSSSLMIAYQSG